MAKRINRAQGTIAQIERGEATTLSNLEELAKHFEIKVGALIDLDLEEITKKAVDDALRPYRSG